MYKTVKVGDDCFEVRIAKYLTNYNEDTNVFTDDFKSYVKQWQVKHSLTFDGIIGPDSWNEIVKNVPPSSLKKHEYVTVVKAIQALLERTETGIFDEALKKAIVAYQSSAGITADGCAGPETFSTFIIDEPSAKATSSDAVRPVNYKQYDKRWGSVVYTKNNTYNKKQTIKNSGCGITSAAMVIATWWDSTITPKDTAADAVKKGYRTTNSGTAWGYFKYVAQKYGASKFVQTSSFATMQKCLAAGGYVVVSFGPGKKGKKGYKKWTSGGHYCVIWKDDGKYLRINDPASAKTARAKGTYAEVKNCAKQYFCFYK